MALGITTAAVTSPARMSGRSHSLRYANSQSRNFMPTPQRRWIGSDALSSSRLVARLGGLFAAGELASSIEPLHDRVNNSRRLIRAYAVRGFVQGIEGGHHELAE